MSKIVNKMLIVSVALAFFLPMACGQNGDSFEPNNEIGDSSEVSLDQIISSTIFPAGDVDFYKLHLDTPGILKADLTNVPKEMKGRIDFYGKNFNWISRKDAENPGDDVRFQIDVGNPGWYYFGVGDLSSKSYGSGYSLRISFEPVVDEEPNGEIGDATEIQVGQGVKAYIFPAGDVDFYKIFLNSSGILEASLTNVPKSIAGSMKGRIDFYGKNYNWIGRKDAETQGDDVTFKHDIGNLGWYYFGIGDLNGVSYNQTYDLQVKFEPVIDEEPNNEIGDATETQLENQTKGFIFPAGDVDFYKVYIDNPGMVQFSLDVVPKSVKTSMKGRIDLYGKNYNWINRKDAEKPGDSVIFKTDIANPGWYYLGIGDLNGGSYDSEYVLKIAR